MKRILLIAACVGLAGSVCAAIHLTPASGSGNGLSWTLGQAAVVTAAAPDSSAFMTQGVLQAPAVPYSGVEETVAVTGPSVQVRDGVIIIGGDVDVRWMLHDIAGKAIAGGSSRRIDISSLAGGVYVLRMRGAAGQTVYKKILKS